MTFQETLHANSRHDGLIGGVAALALIGVGLYKYIFKTADETDVQEIDTDVGINKLEVMRQELIELQNQLKIVTESLAKLQTQLEWKDPHKLSFAQNFD